MIQNDHGARWLHYHQSNSKFRCVCEWFAVIWYLYSSDYLFQFTKLPTWDPIVLKFRETNRIRHNYYLFIKPIIMLSSEIGEARNGVGCIGEFATFGFLTFMISMVNTLINIGKYCYTQSNDLNQFDWCFFKYFPYS